MKTFDKEMPLRKSLNKLVNDKITSTITSCRNFIDVRK